MHIQVKDAYQMKKRLFGIYIKLKIYLEIYLIIWNWKYTSVNFFSIILDNKTLCCNIVIIFAIICEGLHQFCYSYMAVFHL